MPDLMAASIQDRLWHRMRKDLASFMPDIAGNRLLMCCACGRLLPQECFGLEHIIPQQALRRDPNTVRDNRATPANVRGGNLLLCKAPLKHKGRVFYKNGCNSWKGRFYDTLINELVSGAAFPPRKYTNMYTIAGLTVGYLAMVARFGYIVALMRSGLLMRRQYFSPRGLHPALPI